MIRLIAHLRWLATSSPRTVWRLRDRRTGECLEWTLDPLHVPSLRRSATRLSGTEVVRFVDGVEMEVMEAYSTVVASYSPVTEALLDMGVSGLFVNDLCQLLELDYVLGGHSRRRALARLCGVAGIDVGEARRLYVSHREQGGASP